MEKERIIDRFDKYMSFRGLNDNEVTRDLGFSNGLPREQTKNPAKDRAQERNIKRRKRLLELTIQSG